MTEVKSKPTHGIVTAFGYLLLINFALSIIILSVTYKLYEYSFLSRLYHQTKRYLYGASDSTRLTNIITCWGDSLTEGYNVSLGHDYPALLANVYLRKTVNEGVSKETSSQIRSRFYARSRSGSPEHVVIWAGRNNYLEEDRVIDDIASMVKDLPQRSKYLIIGITSGEGEGRSANTIDGNGKTRGQAIRAVNARLLETYRAQYVPIGDILAMHANSGLEADRLALSDDIVPPSLRSDAIHLNDVGQAIVAEAIEQAMDRNGW